MDLQGAYNNSNTPAVIALSSGKDFVINTGDLVSDPSFIVNLQNSSSTFSVWNASSTLFYVSQAGLVMNSASSTITNLNMLFSTSTQATSTYLAVTNTASTSALTVSSRAHIGSSTATTTSGVLIVGTIGSGTSTFANGINLNGGCFAIRGTCVGGGGGGVDGVTVTVFTANGTWTKSNYTGLKFTQVITTAGGGGGGGVGGAAGDTTSEHAGGGGGAGGTAIEIIPAASLGATESVTVGSGGTAGTPGTDGGTGGNSSFGTTAFHTANGGSGGVSTPADGNVCATTGAGSGGAGGTATGGDINITGGAGDDGHCTAEVVTGGIGGASYWGGGGEGGGDPTANGTSAGGNGTAYGSGGGGAAEEDSGVISVSGGAGADGVVVTLNYTSSAGDLAEWYETKENVEYGDVVAISRDFVEYNSRLGLEKTAVLEKATPGASVVGVVSFTPYEVIGGDILGSAKHPRPIALAGRVPVKVSEENGKILAGDLLTISSVPGVAMRATKAGQIIGKALEDSECKEVETCMVLVMVHTSYSTGALLNVAYRNQGLESDVITGGDWNNIGRDIGRAILAEMLQNKKDITASTTLSEVFTDRVVAGLEIISPRVVTDTLVVNSIEPVSSDVILKLTDGGKFILERIATSSLSVSFGSASSTPEAVTSTPVITFDSSGNAFFAGLVEAGSVKAGRIEGLEIVTEKISSLGSELENLASSTPETAAAYISKGIGFEGEVKFASTTEFMALARALGGLEVLSDLRVSGIASTTELRAVKILASVLESPLLDEIQSQLAGLATTTAELKDAGLRIEERVLALEKKQVSLPDVLKLTGLEVSGMTVLDGGLRVEQIGSRGEILTLLNDVDFIGRPYFNSDTGGFAIVRAGERSVEITFEREYLEAPIVNVTMEAEDESALAAGIQYLITKKSAKGFTILLNRPAVSEIKFNWIALAVKNPKIFESLPAALPLTQDTNPTETQITASSTEATSTSTVLPQTILETGGEIEETGTTSEAISREVVSGDSEPAEPTEYTITTDTTTTNMTASAVVELEPVTTATSTNQ
ncbi:MAG: hypothetical protein QXN96_02515 [Candidatus Bathyarchaeia archaeon]